MKKKAVVGFTYGKIIWIFILLALLVFIIFWYAGLKDKMVGILSSIFRK